MRVYISGAITYNPNFKQDFDIAQGILEDLGYQVINPAHLCEVMPDAEWFRYMAVACNLLIHADAICMLPNWKTSKGAGIEFELATEQGLEFIDIMKYLPFAEEGENDGK